MAALVVRLSLIVGFVSFSLLMIVRRFRRVKIDHVSFFDMFTFRNVDRRSFDQDRFELLEQRT
jgi:hypothetical protein